MIVFVMHLYNLFLFFIWIVCSHRSLRCWRYIHIILMFLMIFSLKRVLFKRMINLINVIIIYNRVILWCFIPFKHVTLHYLKCLRVFRWIFLCESWVLQLPIDCVSSWYWGGPITFVWEIRQALLISRRNSAH